MGPFVDFFKHFTRNAVEKSSSSAWIIIRLVPNFLHMTSLSHPNPHLHLHLHQGKYILYIFRFSCYLTNFSWTKFTFRHLCYIKWLNLFWWNYQIIENQEFLILISIFKFRIGKHPGNMNKVYILFQFVGMI